MGLLPFKWLKRHSRSHQSGGKRRQSEPPAQIKSILADPQPTNLHKAINEFNTRVIDKHGNPIVASEANSTYDVVDVDGPIITHMECVAEVNESGADESDSQREVITLTDIPVIEPGKKGEKIHANEVKRFERDNCHRDVGLDDADFGRNLSSPPRSFFKLNQNPFPAPKPRPPSGYSSSDDGLEQTSSAAVSPRGPAPVKPQRSAASLAMGRRAHNMYQRYDLRSLRSEASSTARRAGVGISTEEEDNDGPADGEMEAHISDGGSSSGICSGNERMPLGQRAPRPSAVIQQQQHRFNAPFEADDAERTVTNFDGMFEDRAPGILNASKESYVLSNRLPSSVATCLKVTDLDETLDDRNTSISSRVQRFCNENAASNSGGGGDGTAQSQRRGHRSTGDFSNMHQSFIDVCKPKDIKTRHTKFGSRLKSQMPFSCGTYRQELVTLRKCRPRHDCVRLVEEAIDLDYDMLRSGIRHPNIVTLMAAAYNKHMWSHLVLVLEPCDFTLNYFVHQMNVNISVPEAINVVQQIVSAAKYLHTYGHIHTNITSHCVLIRNRTDNPLHVKLSSFELATAVRSDAIRLAIELRYDTTTELMAGLNVESETTSADTTTLGPADLRRKRSKMPLPDQIANLDPIVDYSYMTVPSEFLVYNRTFRRHLTEFNYQPPELLSAAGDFCYPTVAADVYCITLLLWEMLNRCVPFAVYTQNALVELFGRETDQHQPLLQTIEPDRCRHFELLLAIGLQTLTSKRKLDMEQLLIGIRMAREQFDDEQRKQSEAPLVESEEHEKILPANEAVADDNNLTSSLQPKTPPPLPTQPDQQPQQVGTLVLNKHLHPSTCSALNKTTSNSQFDVQLISSDDRTSDGRTSTIKKRRRPSRLANLRKSTSALFSNRNSNSTSSSDDVRTPPALEVQPTTPPAALAFDDAIDHQKLVPDSNMDVTDHGFNQSAVVDEHSPSTPYQQSVHNISVTKSLLTAEKSRFLNELLDDRINEDDADADANADTDRASKSLGNIIEDPVSPMAENGAVLNRSVQMPMITQQSVAPPSSSSSAYRFRIGNVTLPRTPIARQTKIRRYSWLSEQQLRIETNTSEDEIAVQTTNGSVAKPAVMSSSEPRRKLITTSIAIKQLNPDAAPLNPILKTGTLVVESLGVEKISASESKVTVTHDGSLLNHSSPGRPIEIRFVHNLTSPTPTNVADEQPTTIGWTFGKKRQVTGSSEKRAPIRNSDAENEPITSPIGPKPTRLSYTESMLRKDPPHVPPRALPRRTLTASRLTSSTAESETENVTVEFNQLQSTVGDDVTRDFHAIVRDMEAFSSRNNSAIVVRSGSAATITATTASQKHKVSASDAAVEETQSAVDEPTNSQSVNDVFEAPPPPSTDTLDVPLDSPEAPPALPVRSAPQTLPRQLLSQPTITPQSLPPVNDSSTTFDTQMPQRTPIKETIMQFENWLAHNKSRSPSILISPAADSARSIAHQQTPHSHQQHQPQPQARHAEQPATTSTPTQMQSQSVQTDCISIADCINNSTPLRWTSVDQSADELTNPIIVVEDTGQQQTPRTSVITPTTPQNNNQQQLPAPHQTTTVIKRTVFTESIETSVNSVMTPSNRPHHCQHYHQPTVASSTDTDTETENRRRTRTTQVKLNMLRRQSVAQQQQPPDVRHSICGGAAITSAGVLSALCRRSAVNATTAMSNRGDDVDVLVSDVANRLCDGCADIVKHDRSLKDALSTSTMQRSLESGRNSYVSGVARSSMSGSRCTMMRSTEDFYIDDDFGHGVSDRNGLAVNIELVSTDTSSDLFTDRFDDIFSDMDDTTNC